MNFIFLFFLSLICVGFLFSPTQRRRSKRRSKPRQTMTLLTASSPAAAVFSVRRPIDDDDCLCPHRLLRQRPIETHHGRLLSPSLASSPSETHRNPPPTATLCVVNAALVKTRIIKVITKRKLGSNDYDLRLQMCSRKLPSTLRLSYDYLNVRRNIDVILQLIVFVANWS